MTTKNGIAIIVLVILLLCGGTTALVLHHSSAAKTADTKKAESDLLVRDDSPPVPATAQDELNQARKRAERELQRASKATKTALDTNSEAYARIETVSGGDGKSIRLSSPPQAVRRRSTMSGTGIGGERGGTQPASSPEPTPQYREAK